MRDRPRGWGVPAPAALLLAYATDERARALARSVASPAHERPLIVRTPEEFRAGFGAGLVDVALVDLSAAGASEAAGLAREFPSVAFIALTPYRPADAPALAHCVELGFVDVLAEGVDEDAARYLLADHGYTVRFARAFATPPPGLALASPLQLAVWQEVVRYAGRPVRTAALARALGVTREHLSRAFTAGGAPHLKRAIDLVRLLAAAELAKNPGYDVRDVARVLGFASPSHLARTARRVVGAAPGSLSRLRAMDLIGRFVRGMERDGEGAIDRSDVRG